MRDLLTRLTSLYGASGREQPLAPVVKKEFQRSASEVKEDKFGNVVASKPGSGEFSVMLAAHIDEIGFVVEKVDKDGFAYPSRVGGWNPEILPSKPVRSMEGWGLVSTPPLGLISEKAKKKSVRSDDLFIEGYNLSAGDFLVQDVAIKELGNSNLLAGKSFDDRAGVTALIEMFNRLSDEIEPDVYAVVTVQEEVGGRGAGVTAYSLDPDLGIVLEVALADDFPMGSPYTPQVRVGRGPAITVKDASMISHPSITNFMIEIARKGGIPHQLEILDRGGTDAGRIHLTRNGVPSTVIGIPTRYLHSSVEVLDLRDLEKSVNLVTLALENLTERELKLFSRSH